MSTDVEPRPVTAPDMQGQMPDIQAILATGFASLRYCSYWLLRVEHDDACMAWLDAVLRADLVKSAAEIGRDKDPVTGPHRHSEAVMIAFTFEGLHALGLCEHADFPFPAAYRTGMADTYRSKALGDDRNAPHWKWGDTGADAVHMLVAHYRDDPCSAVESLMCGMHSSGLSGCRVVARVDTCPSYTQQTQADGRNVYESTEPFGFRDGIAQPVIDGMRRSRAEQIARRRVGEQFEDRVVAPGEFILGHVNQYGELAYCPTVDGWPTGKNADGSDSRFALNGSYLAVRQIFQHTDRFRDMVNEHRPKAGEPSLAERMVGRRMNGEPLVQCPFRSADQDAFRYRVADFDGFQCPRGAHVRRANPRDMLAWNVESGIAASKLHRLLRRGRVYAAATPSCKRLGEPECGHKSHVFSARGAPQCAEGLFFMALNADIDRQFEFVQQRWINNRQFADLSGEDDFTSGARAPHAFTAQGMPVGDRTENLAQFTDTIGGGYFFVPGLSALQFIASGCRPPAQRARGLPELRRRASSAQEPPMPATDTLIAGQLIDLPPEAGDVNAPRFNPSDDWLRTASPEQQMTAMWRWFATRFEDPETAVPHDEQGGYVFMEGGPWLADEVLHERFDAFVPEGVVETLVRRLQQEVGNEWAKRQLDESGG